MIATGSGAEILLRTLVDLGVDTIFGYPGGAVLPIYDLLFAQNRIRHVLMRHEAGAAHAAEGYARSTGRPGVVLVTSGPGVTNVVTGLADALMDSIPIVVISGQVATHLIGSDAFQECDSIGITRHCTKYNYLIKQPERVEQVVREAFHVATTGRPGPVHIDLPKDVQVAKASVEAAGAVVAAPRTATRARAAIDPRDVAVAIEMIRAAERPILYTGGGVINSGPQASRKLREFAAMTGIPVTSTLMGLGAFPASSPQWLGMLGMHGTYEANMAMNQADLIIAIGARFDDRVTGRLDAFSPHSRKIHIDIDRSSIGKIVHADVAIVGDAADTLEQMVALWRRHAVAPAILDDWRAQIAEWRRRECLSYSPSATEILPQHALARLWAAVRDRSPIITTEVGQHQMWAAQHLGFEEPNKWLTSGGLGTMGYGLPAAIGAQLGNPDTLVIDVAGEASFQMNMQELATATQYRLPVKIFMLNNEHLGMVRQLQDVTYDGRYAHSYSEALPDFVRLAEAYGWHGQRVDDPADLDAAIAEMLTVDGPALIDCHVTKLANCFPMIPSGAAHTEMLFGSESTSFMMSDEAKALV